MQIIKKNSTYLHALVSILHRLPTSERRFEDAQENNDWRLRIKRQMTNPGLPGKCPLKMHVCLCVCEL